MTSPGYNKYQRAWRPVSIADANRHSVSWSRRNDARDLLDDLSFQHQLAAARSALDRPVAYSDLKTRAQLGPLHTHFPSYPAARACVGLSAICEFKAQAGRANSLLQAAVTLNPDTLGKLDPDAAAKASRAVVEAVANRLCIDQLYRVEGLAAVESYRLFAAAMVDIRFRKLRDVILAAVTLGDLVFGLVKRPQVRRRIHPLTHRILDSLSRPCHRYEVAASVCDPQQLPVIGAGLAEDLMAALAPFLPLKRESPPSVSGVANQPAQQRSPLSRGLKRVPFRGRRPIEPDKDVISRKLAGSDEPVPPSIDETPVPWRLMSDSSKPGQPSQETTRQPDAARAEGDPDDADRLQRPGPGSLDEAEAQALLHRAMKTIAAATGRAEWDDPRVDQVAQALRNSLFSPGAVEASLATRRHKVTSYGSDREGRIHEEILTRCRDRDALQKLRSAVAPIEKKLRSYRWYGKREETVADRLQIRGALDPHRLYRLASSSLLRRRWRRHSVNDYRGEPVIVLVKDGSSSNTLHTTFAGKILAAAFLRVGKLGRFRLFAADYSSDPAGHLVRWLYHPQKTPGQSLLQAADAVASLPPKGQGRNEDVLSISHIVREVLDSPWSKNQAVVVINVTDGKINSPLEEFRSMVRKLRADHRLTYTLVVLGDTTVEVPEADATVHIPRGELQDPHQIADRIARHVNALVRHLRGETRRQHHV